MGVSGSGKSTIQHSLPIPFLTNYTTREIRDGEINGYHINQVDKDTFNKLNRDNFFFEITEYADNLYGTPRHLINKVFDGTSYHCTKDLSGAIRLKDKLEDKACIIYIKPPSLEVIRERMLLRGDSEDDVERRIQYILEVNEFESEKYADHVIYNDDLDKAILDAHRIIIKELINIK